MTQKNINSLTYNIIGAAIEVHKIMGRGLLESVYHQCLKEELNLRNIDFVSEMKIPVIYKTKELESSFRCDLFIENFMVVELKTTTEIHPIFEAKLLNYMNLLKFPEVILINFNCNNIFKEGQKTFVNEYYKSLKIVYLINPCKVKRLSYLYRKIKTMW
ncbi:MAG: GxxExxY protein, partial [Flavobacterium sp.]|nr:GxxExxY protein [Flavobacterium sp.]